MNYFKYKRIIQNLKKISLDKKEEEVLRSQFLSQIGYEQEGIPFNWQRVTVATLAILLLTIAPLSYAAERSLPTDLLYPIKTNINDQVKRVVHIVTKQDVEDFELELLEEKLQETEEIINSNKLTDKNTEKVSENIEKQIEKASEKISNIVKEKDNDKKENIKDNKRDEKEEKLIEKKEIKEKKLKEILKKHKETIEKIKSKDKTGNKK